MRFPVAIGSASGSIIFAFTCVSRWSAWKRGLRPALGAYDTRGAPVRWPRTTNVHEAAPGHPVRDQRAGSGAARGRTHGSRGSQPARVMRSSSGRSVCGSTRGPPSEAGKHRRPSGRSRPSGDHFDTAMVSGCALDRARQAVIFLGCVGDDADARGTQTYVVDIRGTPRGEFQVATIRVSPALHGVTPAP